MDGVFQNLNFAFVYLDDILVASKSESQHRDHLKTIFELLSANGLVINKLKCAFGVTELEYLGHLSHVRWHSPAYQSHSSDP